MSKTPETPKGNTQTPAEQRPVGVPFEKALSTANLENSLNKPQQSTTGGSNDAGKRSPKKEG